MNLIRRSMGALLQSEEYDQYTLRAGCAHYPVACTGDTKYLYLNSGWKYASTTASGHFIWAGSPAMPGDIVRTSPWGGGGVGYTLSIE